MPIKEEDIRAYAEEALSQAFPEPFVGDGFMFCVSPERRAWIRSSDRRLIQLWATDYQGRGWRERLCLDLIKAVRTIEGGGGDVTPPFPIEIIQEEVWHREAGGRRPEAERQGWEEWLEDSEMIIAVGASVRSYGVTVDVTVRRVPGGFPTVEDAMNAAVRSTRGAEILTILRRLGELRQSVWRERNEACAVDVDADAAGSGSPEPSELE